MAQLAVRNISTHLEPTTAVLPCRMTFSIKRYSPAGKVDKAEGEDNR